MGASFSGTFETKEQADDFGNVVKYIIPVLAEGGILLKVQKDTMIINVYQKNILTHVVSRGIYNKFTMVDDTKIGILKPADFVKYINMFAENSSVSFEDNVFTITNGDSDVSFRTADVDLIKEGPATFKGTTFVADVMIDSRFDRFAKAMSVLANEDTVNVKGDKATGKVTFKIANASMAVNTFKLVIDKIAVADDFEFKYSKEDFLAILQTPIPTKKMSFAEKLLRLECTSANLDITYYIPKKAAK